MNFLKKLLKESNYISGSCVNLGNTFHMTCVKGWIIKKGQT